MVNKKSKKKNASALQSLRPARFFPGHRTQERAKISILIFVALSLCEIFYSSRLFLRPCYLR